MSTFNELIDFTRSTTGTYLDSVVYGDESLTGSWTTVTGFDNITSGTGTNVTTTSTSSGASRCYLQINNVEQGKQYKLTVTVSQSNVLSLSVYFRDGASPNSGTLVSGQSGMQQGNTYTLMGVAESNLMGVLFIGTAASFTANVSVKEVIGGQVSGTPLLRTAAINEPRLEYDASGNPLGLLIEEARTNIISNSEALIVASNRAIAESSISPTGEQTAQTWRVNGSASNSPYWYGSANIVSGATYTCSVFVRLPTSGPTVESRYVKLTSQTRMQVGEAVFDLQERTVVSSNMLSESITPVGNGWYRLSATNTATSSGASFSFILWPCINAAGDLYVISAGDDGKALLQTFGMQTEAGAFPTSYIPTSGSTVTRAADVASLPLERFAYNDTKGSVVVTFSNFEQTTATGSRGIVGTSLTGRFAYVNGGRVRSYDGTSVITSSPTVYKNTFIKSASTFDASGQSISVNGTAAVTGSFDNTWGNDGVLYVGRISSSLLMSGHITSLQYYPKRLSNEELQLLTQPSASPTMNLTFDGQATSTLVEGLHD